jgi:hypothetical protein
MSDWALYPYAAAGATPPPPDDPGTSRPPWALYPVRKDQPPDRGSFNKLYTQSGDATPDRGSFNQLYEHPYTETYPGESYSELGAEAFKGGIRPIRQALLAAPRAALETAGSVADIPRSYGLSVVPYGQEIKRDIQIARGQKPDDEPSTAGQWEQELIGQDMTERNLAERAISAAAKGAMIGGGARISRDVPPFTMATERNGLIGLNKVGLRRRGVDRATIDELKRALRLVATPTGNVREQASAALADGGFASAEARRLLEFYQQGQRGFVRARRGAREPDEP